MAGLRVSSLVPGPAPPDQGSAADFYRVRKLKVSTEACEHKQRPGHTSAVPFVFIQRVHCTEWHAGPSPFNSCFGRAGAAGLDRARPRATAPAREREGGPRGALEPLFSRDTTIKCLFRESGTAKARSFHSGLQARDTCHAGAIVAEQTPLPGLYN